MIRMASLPVRKNHHLRPLLPDHASHFQTVFPSVLDPAIGNVEGIPPRDAQDLRGFCRLLRAAFRSAPRAHLASREIENAGAPAALRHFQQSSAASLFDVVAMGS